MIFRIRRVGTQGRRLATTVMNGGILEKETQDYCKTPHDVFRMSRQVLRYPFAEVLRYECWQVSFDTESSGQRVKASKPKQMCCIGVECSP